MRQQASARRSLAAMTAPASVVGDLLRRVQACNNGVEAAARARPLVVGGQALGLVLAKAADELARFPEVFHVTKSSVELVAGDSAEARSAAVADVLAQLRNSGRVPMLAGWRNEAWPVKAGFDSPIELVIERAAGPLFGVPGYGCHVNGLVYSDAGSGTPPRLWVARRAASKPTYPGKLDHVVAGGLSHGERPSENVVRECQEEAGIPQELAAQAKPAGLVSYCQVDETGWGVKRDVLFCYDLELPRDFVPEAQDGEVESFELWELQQVINSMADTKNEDWKPNVCVVIIDMLVRRGFVKPGEVGYVDVVRALRS